MAGLTPKQRPSDPFLGVVPKLPDIYEKYTSAINAIIGPFDFEKDPPSDYNEGDLYYRKWPEVVGDGVYLGQWNREGKCHGRGVHVSHQSVYEGYFKDGKNNGRGRLLNSSS